MSDIRKCPGCGELVGSAAPEGLCPKCLMGQALATESVPEHTIMVTPGQVLPRQLPQPGEQFGNYRIVRELGHGGMGAVYEAEDLESGRYIALKVLGQQLDSPDARKRFLREGRLAASINHPNSVYVYGTEEIDGTPVIAMELVSGGTLQDLVQRKGPLLPPEAVDAILQVIAGLEAAQAIGILHRDVKPSNCFQDSDGATKIGDFGLSISTAARGDTDITLAGSFLGTPAFCSPEQLRGEELNARSDMYSVGVTLYYLLTRRTPFEGKTLVHLLATVLEQPAPSPRKFQPSMPTGLARVVLRCLAKEPGDRFKNYHELRQALAPYSSAAPTPATVSLRCVAGLVDMIVLGLMGLAVQWPLWGSLTNLLNSPAEHPQKFFLSMSVGVLMSVLYFTVLEGLWGASIGKAICRLRVVGPDRNPPGVTKALFRALIYAVMPVLPFWIILGTNPARIFDLSSGLARFFATYSQLGITLLLFMTVRRRNGFAAVHDLLTRTQVIFKAAHMTRPVLQGAAEPLPATDFKPMIGPYHVLKSLEKSAHSEWLLGYDAQLLRKTWVRVVAPGTPPIAPRLRNLGRVGRLRWIAGRRTATENWDAFEAVTGKPLVHLVRECQPWNQVRFWLFDLAKETSVALKDGTLPEELSLDRVWITADGRAKLLDFPAPVAQFDLGERNQPSVSGSMPPRGRQFEVLSFLNEVTLAALEGRGTPATEENPPGVMLPLPLHAREFLNKLPQCPHPDAILMMLTPLLQKLATVTRWRRLGVVAGCALFPILASLGFMFGSHALAVVQSTQPEVLQLNQILQMRAAMHKPWMKHVPAPDDRTYAIYIASHFRSTITNGVTWSNVFVRSILPMEARRFAEQSVVDHPEPAPEEIHQAEAALKSQVMSGKNALSFADQPWFAVAVGAISLLAYVCIPALIAALAFRGGLVLRAAGLAIARRDGAQASRLHVLVRSLVAWAPFLLTAVAFMVLRHPLGLLGTATVVTVPLVGLVVLSLALPGRSLPDRLAGTWLVPR